VPLRERLRELFGSASNEPSTDDGSAAAPSAPPSTAAHVASPAVGKTRTEETSGRVDTDDPLTSGSGGLPIAQGQELLGPCRDCTGYWTRELAPGQKPLTCPICKRVGPLGADSATSTACAEPPEMSDPSPLRRRLHLGTTRRQSRCQHVGRMMRDV
jgi:hypothetical protein